MKRLFNVKDNFIEKLLVRIFYLFLIILGIAILFVTFDIYKSFLNYLLFPLALIIPFYMILFLIYNKDSIKIKKIEVFILFFILLFTIFNSFFFYEAKIEAGHDQGGYFNTALLLGKTGSYFKDYQQEPNSLSFPGYKTVENDKIKWAFIVGGATYFSMFYSLFGLQGFSVALAFALFFGLFFLFLIGKQIRNWKTGFFAILFFMFYYYTIYFSRATWVENIQFMLIWFYAYLFIKGYFSKKINYLLLAFLPLALLMSFRLETVLFVLPYFVLISYTFFSKKYKRNLNYKKPSKLIILLILFGIFLFLSPFIFDSHEMLQGNNSPIKTIWDTIKSPSANIAHGSLEEVPYNQQIFIWVFLYYLFGSVIILILVLGIWNFFKEEKKYKKRIFILALLISPIFIMLFRPSIQLYVPWAARRFWAVLIPFIFLLFASFITNPNNVLRKSKELFVFVIVTIFILNSFSGFSILTFKEGKGIINFEKEFSSNFNETDLVIFWDRYGYENYGPPSYFLYGTNIVFDRSPAHNKSFYALYMRDYADVYLATSLRPKQNTYPYFKGKLKYVKTIESPVFEIFERSGCHTGAYSVNPRSFKNYSQIKEICNINNPPTKTKDYQIKWNIYKLNNSYKKEFIKNYSLENYNIESYKAYWREYKE